jgi:glucokinase
MMDAGTGAGRERAALPENSTETSTERPTERPTETPPGPTPGSGATRRGPVLALDLGGTQIRAAVVTEGGAIHARVARRTPVAEGPEAIVAACRDTLIESRAAYEAGPAQEPGAAYEAAPAYEAADRADGESTAAGPQALLGIAISSPGPIDPWRGVIVEPPNLGPEFRDIPLAERLEAALGLPAYLDRDTQIAALGEGAFGAARGARDYLYVTVSSGVGGAIVSEGRLLMGPDGTAGELGHFPVDFHGPACGCGAPGHLEAFASGVAIAREARRRIASGAAPDLEAYAREASAREAYAGTDGGPMHPTSAAGDVPIDARQVAEAEEAGVATAHAIMEEVRAAFAASCVGWVDVFDPELIVVGGSIAQGQGDRLLEPAREAIARYAFKTPGKRVRIVPAALGEDVSLVGGLVLVNARSGDDRWRAGRPAPRSIETTRAHAVSATTT